jgi:hypothetical protein
MSLGTSTTTGGVHKTVTMPGPVVAIHWKLKPPTSLPNAYVHGSVDATD